MSYIDSLATQYRKFRERLLELETDIDERTLADTLEGMSELPDMLTATIRHALDDEAMGSALRTRIEEMEGRVRRVEERARRRRSLVLDAMVEAGLEKLPAADFTLSVRAAPSRVVVVDEEAIPATYWEPRTPRLDKASLLARLRHGDQIPGACLSNPEMSLQVRTK